MTGKLSKDEQYKAKLRLKQAEKKKEARRNKKPKVWASSG
jgi:hypothetical protein